ncbi:MAG: LacI family transcriptional regulator [Pseudobutyrivibrio sp.]|nr:LacI family transcriptional regulator [Pseudobutyrivibrio sp.]
MTLKDIAALAGVSVVTVSNVINGNHKKVSQKTIDKVNKIIEENDFHVNATARSLAKKKSNIIGVVIPYLDAGDIFSQSPYYTEIMAYLENYIRNNGYYMMMRSVGTCKEAIPLFSTWNVDGVIFLGAHRDEIMEILPKIKFPAVFIDSYADDLNIVNIGIDDFKSGYLAARYIIGKGHKAIAWAGPDYNDPGVINERFRGFTQALLENDIDFDESSCFVADTFYDQGVKLGGQIAVADKEFTAVITQSDILALGIMEGLRKFGIRIPEDISIIGFDNIPACMYSYPQLTSISQSIRDKAKIASESLLAMIENKEVNSDIPKVDVEVVERQSVKQI